jgi:hypothetical protein
LAADKQTLQNEQPLQVSVKAIVVAGGGDGVMSIMVVHIHGNHRMGLFYSLVWKQQENLC